MGEAIGLKHHAYRTVQEPLGRKDVKTTTFYTLAQPLAGRRHGRDVASVVAQEIEHSRIDNPILAAAHVVTGLWHQLSFEIRKELTCLG